MVLETTPVDVKARSLAKAIDTFGDLEVAETWMVTPIAALSNVSPVQHILKFDDTLVIAILIRIDHGIPE